MCYQKITYQIGVQKSQPILLGRQSRFVHRKTGNRFGMIGKDSMNDDPDEEHGLQARHCQKDLQASNPRQVRPKMLS